MSTNKIVFVFPGQGSQVVGMGRDLVERFPVARQTFEEASDALGFSLAKLCFEGPEEQLRLTEFTQPAIFTVSTAACRVLAEQGVHPSFVAGHSLGEYSAHVAAGTISFADGVRAVRKRGQFMQEAVPAGEGAMAAILALAFPEIAKACVEVSAETGKAVSPANINSPDQVVISGAKEAVEKAVELCKSRGARKAVLLPVSAPFHCALMQSAQDRLAELLRTLPFADPSIPVAVNVDAAFVSGAEKALDAMIRQVTGAVRWVECSQLLIAQHPACFIEVGPGKVLCGLMRQIDRQQKCLNVEDSASLQKVLAALETEVTQRSM
jgi:[acyl-carrier-protein] S-malonyltransferase